jgi:hypothetical protein
LKVRATTNPYGCVPYGEVLTVSRGWLPIQDILAGERVISCRPDGTLCEADVSHVTVKEWEGNMVSCIGSGLHMVFTEDHRLPHLSTDRSRHTVKSFKDLPGEAIIRRGGYIGLSDSPQQINIPHISTTRKCRLTQPLTVDAGDFAELLGWYVSGGSLLEGKGKAFAIAQMKSDNRERIERLLNRMGFTYRKSFNKFMIYSESWHAFFKSLGRYSRNKALPDSFHQWGSDMLKRCLDAAMLGDGHGGIYYTTSRKLADQIAEIGVKLGKSVYIHSRRRKSRKYISYAVNLSDRDVTTLITGNHRYNVGTKNHSKNVVKTPFKGRVYCLTVPDTETFFIRQNGCVWLSGNTGHNWVKARWRLPIPRGKIVGPIIRDSLDLDGNIEPPRVAIHGYLQENKVLLAADPRYVQKLRSAASNPAELKAWLYGDWNIVAGGMFDDVWNPRVHIVPTFPSEIIPRGWKLFRGYDHGSSKPFSVGIWAESNGEPLVYGGKAYGIIRGDLIRVREWYGWSGRDNEGCKLASTDIAQGILDRLDDWGLRGRVKPGPADSSIFDAYEGSKSVASDMKQKGVRWVPAVKGPGSRKAGWEQMRKFLKGSLPDAESGIREEPGMFISECCMHFIRTVPVLPRDKRDPDDVDTEAEDHVGDETRYVLRRKMVTMKQGAF